MGEEGGGRKEKPISEMSQPQASPYVDLYSLEVSENLKL